MASALKPGDKVRWKTSQGETTGTVEKKITAPTRVKGHLAKASPDDPQFAVKSDKTGARAIHHPGSLSKH
jgi:hypothetical protein